MSKRSWVVSILLSTLAVSAVPAVAGAAPRPATAVTVQQGGLGARSFGRRPTFAPRRTVSPYRRSTRVRSRDVFGSVLKVLGIAYLAHLLFGIGAGGSPLGLLLLVALIAFVAGRSRGRTVSRRRW